MLTPKKKQIPCGRKDSYHEDKIFILCDLKGNTKKLLFTNYVRSQEKNSNLNRDSNSGPPDLYPGALSIEPVKLKYLFCNKNATFEAMRSFTLCTTS